MAGTFTLNIPPPPPPPGAFLRPPRVGFSASAGFSASTGLFGLFSSGFFDFFDNLFDLFDGFIRYSLDWPRFDDGFFDSFDNLANFFDDFVEYSSFFACFFEKSFFFLCLDWPRSIELLSVDMDFSSSYSRSISSLIVLTKFFQLVSDFDKKFCRKLIF